MAGYLVPFPYVPVALKTQNDWLLNRAPRPPALSEPCSASVLVLDSKTTGTVGNEFCQDTQSVVSPSFEP